MAALIRRIMGRRQVETPAPMALVMQHSYVRAAAPRDVVPGYPTFGPWADHASSCKCNICR